MHVTLSQIAQCADRQFAGLWKLGQYLEVFHGRFGVLFLAEKIVCHLKFCTRNRIRVDLPQVNFNNLAVLGLQNVLDFLGHHSGCWSPGAVTVLHKHIIVFAQRLAIRADGLGLFARFSGQAIRFLFPQAAEQRARPGHRALAHRQPQLLERIINRFDDVHVAHQYLARRFGIPPRQLDVGHDHDRIHKLQVQPAPLQDFTQRQRLFKQFLFVVAGFLFGGRHQRLRPRQLNGTLHFAGRDIFDALVADRRPLVIADHFLHLRILISGIAIAQHHIFVRRRFAFIQLEELVVKLARFVRFPDREVVPAQRQTDRLRPRIVHPHFPHQRFSIRILTVLDQNFGLNDLRAFALVRVRH